MKTIALILLLFPVITFSQEGNSVKIAPALVKDQINVSIADRNDKVSVKIYTQDGEEVWSEYREESEFNLNLKLYPAGVYFVKIGVSDKEETLKFIKRYS
ncbi:MAG: T9SS type A sorting domain-containing protein [Crocinitomicaceae bacterium]|nr:T9SS type A sorting domain-containing protein [Crocinitomicaceae bacterium]